MLRSSISHNAVTFADADAKENAKEDPSEDQQQLGKRELWKRLRELVVDPHADQDQEVVLSLVVIGLIVVYYCQYVKADAIPNAKADAVPDAFADAIADSCPGGFSDGGVPDERERGK